MTERVITLLMGICLTHNKTDVHHYEILTNYQCSGIVRDCVHINELIKIQNIYNKTREIDKTNIDDIICILNGYNHAILMHRNDNDFEYIYNLFDTQCTTGR